MKRALSIKPIIVAIGVLVGIMLIYAFYADKTGWNKSTLTQINSSAPIGGLKDGIKVKQTLSLKDNSITAFSILFATYNRVNDCNVTVTLCSQDNSIVFKQTFSAAELIDNAFFPLALEKSITISPNMYLEITSDALIDDNCITVWRSADPNDYADGTLYIDGQEIDGDLCFSVETVNDGFSVKLQKSVIVFVIVLTMLAMIMTLYFYSGKKVIDVLIDYRYLIFGVLFIVLVLFSVHGFSINLWTGYLPTEENFTTTHNTLCGIQRPITSDAWAVTIPQTLSQCELGFPFYNNSISSEGANALLYGLPTWDITILGRPTQWGYLILGKSMGMAWFYWFRIFGLLLSSFEVAMMITKKNKYASACVAVLVAFSPIVQWWGCHNLPETILYGLMMLAGGYHFLDKFDSLKAKIISAAIIGISAIGFVLMLYPATMVPFGYFVMLMAIVAVIQYRKKIRVKLGDVIIIAATVVFALIILARFFIISKEDIQLLTGTVFPGERFCIGGELNIDFFAMSFMQWTLPFFDVNNYNNCEISQFIPVLLPVILGFPFIIAKDKENRLRNRSLYFALLFFCAWMVFRFPDWFASATLMYNVTGNRLLWTIGIISVFIFAVMIDYFMKNDAFSRKNTVFITLGVLTVMLYLAQKSAFLLNDVNKYLILSISALWMIALCVALFRSKKVMLSVTILTFTVTAGMTVQPLNIGLGSLYDNSLSEAIEEIRDEDEDALWLADAYFPTSNYLLIYGVDVFNATNVYPDYSKWSKIDPEHENEDSYNRYCQVSVVLGEKTSFELLCPDHIKLVLSIDDVLKADIDYIFSKTVYSDNRIATVYSDPINSYYIYKTVK